MDGLGSTLYRLTWKRRTTPSGASLYRLAASARPTSETGCGSSRQTEGGPTGWNTPVVSDHIQNHGEEGVRARLKGEANFWTGLKDEVLLADWPTPLANMGGPAGKGKGRQFRANLKEVAKMATWPTPLASAIEKRGQNATGGPNLSEVAKSVGWPTPKAHENATWNEERLQQKLKNETGYGLELTDAAGLTNWQTPTVTDSVSSPPSEEGQRGYMAPLSRQVMEQAPWATPMANETGTSKGWKYSSLGEMALWTDPDGPEVLDRTGRTSGPKPSGSRVETATSAQLNPALARWLMGYPTEWDDCAPSATPSSRKSRRKS